MIVYYTGTGNSRYCAELLADRLNDDVVDAFHFIKDGIAAELISEKPWVFVCPTHCWKIPPVFEAFIKSAFLEGSGEAYFVMTCGSDIGEAGKTNAKIVLEKGLNYRGTLQVVMPENYIAMFDAPNATEATEIINSAVPVLERGMECIANGESFFEQKTGAFGKLKSGIVNDYFFAFIVKDKKFTASSACVSCGRCVEGCVKSNIMLVNGKPKWGGSCIHCMACICYCPVSAIEYGKASVGEPRYKCPPYKKGF